MWLRKTWKGELDQHSILSSWFVLLCCHFVVFFVWVFDVCVLVCLVVLFGLWFLFVLSVFLVLVGYWVLSYGLCLAFLFV